MNWRARVVMALPAFLDHGPVAQSGQSIGLLIPARRAGGRGLPSPPLHQFLTEKTAQSLSPRTVQYYEEKLNYLCNHSGGRVFDLTKSDVLRILASLSCNAGGKQAYLRAWKTFYSWAEDSGFVATNPCRKVRIRVPRPLRHSVDVNDIARLIDCCRTDRDRALVSMLADTGLRLSELAGLQPTDVDLPSGTIKVWGKGARQRVVRYGPRTAEMYVVKTSGTKGEPLKRATWTLTGSGSSQICQPPFG